VNCMILTVHHEGNKHENEIYRPVSIEDETIIYAGVTVLPGSCIPANSIIGAGQVVRRM
jgi:acetyltransferase-like isoleucine patch superfamily enzyme